MLAPIDVKKRLGSCNLFVFLNEIEQTIDTRVSEEVWRNTWLPINLHMWVQVSNAITGHVNASIITELEG